ncbi:hypothetical protein BGZ58_003529, partial [Dissophora ornata]
MSGLILNCLLPFVRPPRTVSVQEAQNLSLNDYLDAASIHPPSHLSLSPFLSVQAPSSLRPHERNTFNSAPSIVQDQNTRQGLLGVYDQQSKKNGSAPSIQQLFNAARAACAVEHDKSVITWLEALLSASGNHAAGHQPNPTPVVPPTNNNNNNNNNSSQGGSGGSEIFVNPIFFPSEQSFHMLVKVLDDAKKSLDICVYTITDDHLANAIIRAHDRGVKVRIISDNDKAGDLGSDINRLRDDNHIPSR